MYFPRSYITCLTLLSKLSRRDRGRTYCNNIKIVSLNFSKSRQKNTNNNMHENKKIQQYICTIIITLMKTCQSCVLSPAKSPFMVMILFMLEPNLMGNLIFRMTSFTKLIFYSIKNHGSEFILIWFPFL